MSEINNKNTAEPSQPCPPNCDPVEWDRLLNDNINQALQEESERLYKQALDQGAPPFNEPKDEPCPPNCDPVEWDRHQRDNKMFAYARHVQETISKFGPQTVEPDEGDGWPMDWREAEQLKGANEVHRRAKPR